jgi:hypothetical protein
MLNSLINRFLIIVDRAYIMKFAQDLEKSEMLMIQVNELSRFFILYLINLITLIIPLID